MSDWISVENELPLEGTLVLATGFDYGDESKKRHYVVAMRIDEYWYDEDDVNREFTHLTHWMPLPEPPKEIINET